MSQFTFNPVIAELIDLINNFAKAPAIVETVCNIHSVVTAERIDDSYDKRQHAKPSPLKPVHSSSDVQQESLHAIPPNSIITQTYPQTSLSTLATLEYILESVQSLRDGLVRPVEAFNTLFSMYIIQSFDIPLSQVLTPSQCVLLLEAIRLSDGLSELDKQINALDHAAIENEREEDLHLELVRSIRSSFAECLERLHSVHTNPDILRHLSHTSATMFSDLTSSVEASYSAIRVNEEGSRQLRSEQENMIAATRSFLDHKMTRVKFGKDRGYGGQSPECDRWPTATIPFAQLATMFLFKIFGSSSIPLDAVITTDPVKEGRLAPSVAYEAIQAAPVQSTTSSPSDNLQDIVANYNNDASKSDIEFLDDKEPASSPAPVTEADGRSTHQIRHAIPHNLKELHSRRDSGISLLSSTGRPDTQDLLYDETLTDEDGLDRSYTQDGEIDENCQVAGISVHVSECSASSDKEHSDSIADLTEIIIKPTLTIEGRGQNETTNSTTLNDDIYSASPTDCPSKDGLLIAEEDELFPDAASNLSSSITESISPPPMPFISTHWPRRAWLQTILSVLGPGPEPQVTSPVSASFVAEPHAPPAPSISMGDWHCGFDSWWASTMRGLAGRNDRTCSDLASITTSTSEQYLEAADRSADSIDS